MPVHMRHLDHWNVAKENPASGRSCNGRSRLFLGAVGLPEYIPGVCVHRFRTFARQLILPSLDNESELTTPFVPPLPLFSAASTPVPSVTPTKHQKIKFIQAKMPAVSSPLAQGSSPVPSEMAPPTREPSLDTEMLSLAGEGHENEPEDHRREVDMDMDSLLGE